MRGLPTRRSLQSTAAFAALVLFGSAEPPQVPSVAIVAEPRTIESWKQQHDAIVKRSQKGGVDVAFIGDSITHRWELEGKEVWDQSFAAWKPMNLGVGGDRTQNLLWRITTGKELVGIEPKVFVLLIGTNNIVCHKSDEIAAGVKAIVAELRKQKPTARILVLGLLPRSGMPVADREEFATSDHLQPAIETINVLLNTMRDDNVRFLDLGKLYLNRDGGLLKSLMPDYLHLSSTGYRILAKAIANPVDDMLKNWPTSRSQANVALQRVDACREHLMMWLSGEHR
jgi:lysophospholipase L1-like esterase